MPDDRSRRRIRVHTDIHDVRALTDTGAIPLPRTPKEQHDGPSPTERSRRSSGKAR
ncbi:hypothetical protein [Amnibacterium kyonggiense]|uniref:Uncharacterized protein n=1 Tax=Amnibacterium kyonggiense TaxID=595671 RepID=A0A4R7FR38_9MICO|nr:hypothetical protein [Amnibacterium kyonggiense]TDS80267.1 hypothetical protein CLV52_0823 [Amnibacterium kyonggiense]